MTWNNSTNSAELPMAHTCLLTFRDFNNSCAKYSILYYIPSDLSGSELNLLTCKGYNRRGTQCRECLDGYGPAAFSTVLTVPNTDISAWVLNLLFYLTTVTLMYLVFIDPD